MIFNKMYNKISKFIVKNKIYRRLILIFGDIFISQFAIILSLFLFYENINSLILKDYFALKILFVFTSIPIYIFTGQYSTLTSYLGLKIFVNSF